MGYFNFSLRDKESNISHRNFMSISSGDFEDVKYFAETSNKEFTRIKITNGSTPRKQLRHHHHMSVGRLSRPESVTGIFLSDLGRVMLGNKIVDV